MAKTRRVYSGNATPATVPAGLAAAATSCTVSAATGWPGSGPFYAVISPGTSSEEKVLVGSISGTTLSSLTRGVDGTSDTTHAPGAAIYPVFTAVDADEANELTSKWTTKGDIVSHGATTFATVSVGTNSHVLQADSAQAAGIKWGQVATAGIADGAVTEVKLGSDSVTASKIASAAVGASELASNAVETAKIADDAVTNAKIGPGAVDTTELADGAVETVKIADANVTEAKLATSVAGSGLAGGGGTALSVNVDNTGIEVNADTLRLKDAGVVEAKLASNAVTTAKIADDAVTLAKVANEQWTAFTPTWTNLTVGNGTQSFRYVQIGNTVVLRGSITLGSTSSISGAVSFALPVNADMPTNSPAGTVNLIDGGTTEYFGPANISGNTLSIRVFNASGTHLQNNGVNATTPFTWTNTDSIIVVAIYEAD